MERQRQMDSPTYGMYAMYSTPEATIVHLPEARLKYSSPSLRGEIYFNLASGVLELKLHKVHYAAKSSELALMSKDLIFQLGKMLTLRVRCTNIKSSWERRWTSLTHPQCQLRGSQVHFASQARLSVLGYPFVDIGLKLHSVHYAVKSSSQARRTWLHSAPCAVST